MAFIFSKKLHPLALRQTLELAPGCGPRTSEKIITQLDEGKSLKECSVPQRSRDFFESLSAFKKESLSKDTLENLIHFSQKLLFSEKEDNSKKIKDLYTLSQEFRECGDWDSFYTEIILNMDLQQDDFDDQIVLSTIHSAKGKEWTCVHILAVNEGGIPTHNCLNLEEERRLLYVAMTRARKSLTLYIENNKELNKPSRFIKNYCYFALNERQNFPQTDFESYRYESPNYKGGNQPGTALAYSDDDELSYIPLDDF